MKQNNTGFSKKLLLLIPLILFIVDIVAQDAHATGSVTVTITLNPDSTSNAISASNYFTVSYTNASSQASTKHATGTTTTLTAATSTTVTISATTSASSGLEQWCLKISSGTGTCSSTAFSSGAGPTLGETYYYYDLLTQSTNIQFQAQTLPSSYPDFDYYTAPVSAGSSDSPTKTTTALTGGVTGYWMLRGTFYVPYVLSSSGTSSDQWSASQVTSGLAAYWPLDEGAGTSTYDLSGNENTGTLTNTPTWASGASCKFGNCLTFVGASDQYVGIASAASLSPEAGLSGVITLSAWVNIASTAATGDIISKVAGSNYEYELYSDGSGHIDMIIYTSGGGTICNIATGVLTTNTWQFVTGTFGYETGPSAADQCAIYLNGVTVVNAATYTGEATAGTAPVYIGGRADNSRYFTGKIDDVRIYDRILTASEINELYLGNNPALVQQVNTVSTTFMTTYHQQYAATYGFQNPAQNLVDYLPLNEGIGTTVYDYALPIINIPADTGMIDYTGTNVPMWESGSSCKFNDNCLSLTQTSTPNPPSVTSSGQNTCAGAYTCQITGNTVADNNLVVDICVIIDSGNGDSISITDSQIASPTDAGSVGSNSFAYWDEIYGIGNSGTSTVTCSDDNPSSYMISMIQMIFENGGWSGSITADGSSTSGIDSSAGTGDPSCTLSTMSNANDIDIGWAFGQNAISFTNSPSGYSIIGPASGPPLLEAGYYIASSVQSGSVPWMLDANYAWGAYCSPGLEYTPAAPTATGGYVEQPLSAGDNSPFSLSAWVYFTSYTDSVIMGVGGPNTAFGVSYMGVDASGNLWGGFDGGGFTPFTEGCTASQIVPLNQWALVNLVPESGENIMLYVNGVGKTCFADQSQHIMGAIWIGTDGSGSYYGTLTVQEVRVYNTTLSTSQIQALYTASAGASPSPSITGITLGQKITILLPFAGDNTIWFDSLSAWNMSAKVSQGSTLHWYAFSGLHGFAGSGSYPSYIMDDPFTVSFILVGGGYFNAPILTYVQSGKTQHYTLTSTPTIITADVGSPYSVTQSLIAANGSLVISAIERAYTNESDSGTFGGILTISYVYYHQFYVPFQFVVAGGAAHSGHPTFTYVQFGVTRPGQTLFSVKTPVWVDAGTPWTALDPWVTSGNSLTPQPLAGIEPSAAIGTEITPVVIDYSTPAACSSTNTLTLMEQGCYAGAILFTYTSLLGDWFVAIFLSVACYGIYSKTENGTLTVFCFFIGTLVLGIILPPAFGGLVVFGLAALLTYFVYSFVRSRSE